MLTLGELISALEAFPPETSVHFDILYLAPTDFDSYRGYYEFLALGWAEDSLPITVGSLLKAAKACVGGVFQGYKGGEYAMWLDTPVFMANYGKTGRRIVGVTDHFGMVRLLTEEDD